MFVVVVLRKTLFTFDRSRFMSELCNLFLCEEFYFYFCFYFFILNLNQYITPEYTWSKIRVLKVSVKFPEVC